MQENIIISKTETIKPTTIEFSGCAIRMVIGDDGEPRFVAKDLVEAVGASWNGAQNLSHLPADFRGVASVMTPSGVQSVITLTEAGMNMYLFRSDKPAALPWQRHLAEVVLPSIRKTGSYSVKPMTQAEMIAASANLLVSIEREQAAQSNRLATIETKLLESSTELESLRALPPATVGAVAKTDGMNTVALIKAYAAANFGVYHEAFNMFHREIEYRLRIDLKTREKNAKVKGKRLVDIIDESGKSAEIYAVARALFG